MGKRIPHGSGERGVADAQLARIVEAVTAAVKPMFETILERIEGIERRQPGGKARMTVKTAAALYDVNPSTLRVWCLRGEIPGASKKGKSWYVTGEGMDQVFVEEGRRKRGRWPRH
jgi:Helix-turn-helix domain